VRWRVIDGCPCPAGIAPYVDVVLRDAGQAASSIYRGTDRHAVRILHRHGKHTQAEIHRELPAISNPPGYSQHELRSDGAGNPHVPRGGKLHSWQVGVDSGGDDPASQHAITAAAQRHGWHVRHPYKRGVEGHHWCFATKPRPHSVRMRLRILKLRATLPRR
jgi:hypothetical protein